MSEELRILAIGDIIGKPGRTAVAECLEEIKTRENIDMCIANGENAAGGIGITPPVAEELFSAGVDVITTGNHVWDKKEVKEIMGKRRHLLRPYNYPPGVPGPGYEIFELKGGLKAGVLNLAGRVFMANLDCPFRTGEEAVRKMKESTPVIIIDIHAEATAEKAAVGWHFDGLVSAVLGTHTHVQTADERLLPGKTAYITDIGMTGSLDSVIGVDRRQVIQRFLTQMPVRLQPESGNIQISGVIIGIDPETGRAASIKRLQQKIQEK